MASRKERKARLKRERLDAERREARGRWRRRVGALFSAGTLVMATVAALYVGFVVLAAGGSGTGSGGPFGQHYDGLEQRRVSAQVPTMAEGGESHFHPHLALFARGEPIKVPANIGIDPERSQAEMAGLHTHDESGTIHAEAADGARLSQFLAIWGVEVSQSGLGPYEPEGPEKVRMWVNGKRSRAYGDLKLADGQQIVIVLGTEAQTPPLGSTAPAQ